MRVVGREAEPDIDAAPRLARLADVAEGGAAAQPGDRRTGIGRQRAVEQLDGLVVVAEQPRPDMAAQRQRQRIEAVEREREPAQPLGLHVVGPSDRARCPGRSARRGRSRPAHRPSHSADRAPSRARTAAAPGVRIVVLEAVEQVEPAQHAFVGVEALGMLAQHAPQLRSPAPAARSSPPPGPTSSSCSSKRSAASPAKRSLQIAVPLSQSASSADSRTLSPARRTLPVSM